VFHRKVRRLCLAVDISVSSGVNRDPVALVNVRAAQINEYRNEPPVGLKRAANALIQCALIAQRYNPYLKKYYEKIKNRRGTGKAIVALARKSLGITYRTPKNNRVFEDFPNFVPATPAKA